MKYKKVQIGELIKTRDEILDMESPQQNGKFWKRVPLSLVGTKVMRSYQYIRRAVVDNIAETTPPNLDFDIID